MMHDDGCVICPKCGAEDSFSIVPEVTGTIEKRSMTMVLIHIALTIVTSGLWLVVALWTMGSKGTIQTEYKQVCSKCAFTAYKK